MSGPGEQGPVGPEKLKELQREARIIIAERRAREAADREAEGERVAIQREQEEARPLDDSDEFHAARAAQRDARKGTQANANGSLPSEPEPAPRKLSGINLSQMRPHLADGYLVKGFITPRTLTGIIGASGSGKTFFATDLAAHIAAGRQWRGRRVRGGLVLYVALEGPVSAENRFVAARQNLRLPEGTPLRLTPGPLNLRNPPDVQLLIELIGESEEHCGAKIAAVFVDTLSRALAGGDENGSEDMGALIAGTDAVRLATGATIIVVHHLGKDEARGARGHSSLKAALDTEIEVSERGDAHVATVTKQRDLVRGEQFAFKLRHVELGRDDDGDPVTTCVPEPLDEAPQAKRVVPAGANQRKLLAALQEWQREHPTIDVLSGINMRALAQGTGIQKEERRR